MIQRKRELDLHSMSDERYCDRNEKYARFCNICGLLEGVSITNDICWVLISKDVTRIDVLLMDLNVSFS